MTRRRRNAGRWRGLRQSQAQNLPAHRNTAVRLRATTAQLGAQRQHWLTDLSNVDHLAASLPRFSRRRVIGLLGSAANSAPGLQPIQPCTASQREISRNFLSLVRQPARLGVGQFKGVARQAKLELLVAQRRRQELRFYRSRPRLRLPATAVTRQRRRHGGLGLFARNTLKRPRTRVGMENSFLPPKGVYTAIFSRAQLGGLFTDEVVHTLRKQHSDDAQVWVPPPSRNNRKLQFFIRRARLAKLRRLEQSEVDYNRLRLGLEMLTLEDSARPYLEVARAKLQAPTHRLAASIPQRVALQGYQRQILRPSLMLPDAVPISAKLRKVQRNRCLRSRAGVFQKRGYGLWYSRSARSMRQVERSLTAWAPQLQVKWRR